MSLIASLLLCGAALPAFAKLSNPKVAQAQAAIRVQDASAAQALQTGYADEADADVRAWTIRAVSALKVGRSSERRGFFAEALKDASPLVRQAAAEALGRMGGAAAASALSAGLATEKNAGVRVTIASQLEAVKDPAADAALSKALAADADPNVRLRAGHALRAKGRRDAFKASGKDKDARIRRLAQ